MPKKPLIETCVDCGNGTYHHEGDDPNGAPLCRVCEYLRRERKAAIEAQAYRGSES